MSLQAFSFPVSETRFFKAGSFIYNFKIRGGSSFSGEEAVGNHCFSHELEDIIRTVLGNLKNLQPFSSAHFNVFPYKKRWERVSQMMCKNCWRDLKAYPFILTLYLERNEKQAEEKLSSRKKASQLILSVSGPQPKRCKRDSPPEDAMLKDLMPVLKKESKVSMPGRLHRGNCHEMEKVEEDPEYAGKKENRWLDGHQQKAAGSAVRESGNQCEMQPGTIQGVGEAEDAGEENVDSLPQSPGQPGILTQLASHIFPFSLFFKNPKSCGERHIQD